MDNQEIKSNLRRTMESHGFWGNKLLTAIKYGYLEKEDYKLLFEQYYFYSKNFTRYLSGLMANMEDDLFRSKLSENLWEEGGGAKPEDRHAQIFRNFLKNALNIEIGKIKPTNSTMFFVKEYLDFCKYQNPMASSSFLSLGTEAIVPKLYGIMVEGMLGAGIEEKDLHFFRLHMACDDAHAETLEQIMESYSSHPNWANECERALDYALTIRENFFNDLYEQIRQRRIGPKLDKIQNKNSLLIETEKPKLVFRPDSEGVELYKNSVPRLNVEFTVTRAPFEAEVIDARVVKIPSGKFNENHRHAHETVYYILSGKGKVVLDKDTVLDVSEGDSVFIPRWCFHQTENTGQSELKILAITDWYLTGKALIGDYNSTARMKK